MKNSTVHSETTKAPTSTPAEGDSHSPPPRSEGAPTPSLKPGPAAHGPLSDSRSPARPGISNRTLRENGITITELDPSGGYGFLIPYFYEGGEYGRSQVWDEATPDGFKRERLARPAGGRKYSQPMGSAPHIYFPADLQKAIRKAGYLVITEGEFKALALVEAGYPAIGIGGIYNFQKDGVLLLDFVEFLDCLNRENLKLSVLYFLGDADTALNHAFAAAATKMREQLAAVVVGLPIRLPRMPVRDLETRKGIDDAKAAMSQREFDVYMKELLNEAVELTDDLDQEDLTALLFNREEEAVRDLIASATPAKKIRYRDKLAALANHVRPEVADDMAEFAIETGLVKKKSHFKGARERQREKFDQEMAKKNRADATLVKVHYAPSSKKNYLYQTASGDFTFVDRTGARNYLISKGFSQKGPKAGRLSEVDQIITQGESFPLGYAGPVGGRRAGLYQENGMRILVPRGPDLLKPEKGDWPTLASFLTSKFNQGLEAEEGGGHGCFKEQFPFFLGWLSRAVGDLYTHDGRFQPNQALVLCGRVNVGKNIIQDIVTEALGRRKADPFAYMEGTSGFNGELIEAEHWQVADQQTSTKYVDRARLAACIKQTCVNASMRVNAKFSQPINIEFFRRLTISLNDEPDALRVLPPLTPDFEDKLMILHVLPGLPFGHGRAFTTYRDWWPQVVAEMPAFVHYLACEHAVAPEHHDLRYGVRSHKDPEIRRRINIQSPEECFLEIVDQCVFAVRTTTWIGTARELHQEIFSFSQSRELEIIGCTGPNKVGQFLAKLMIRRPERFEPSTTVNGLKRYRILPPQVESPLTASQGEELSTGGSCLQAA